MSSILISTASDNTKIYSYEKADKILTKIKSKNISRQDLIMILLVAQEKPIHGRILLMKELFLLYRRLLHEKSQDPKFVPYKFGPYSFHLVESVSTLSQDGYLEVHGRRNSNSESFTLTSKGRDLARKTFNQLPKSIQNEIIKKRKGWDQLGTEGILNYVYTHYPSFKTNSVLKNRYKDIIWGH